MTRNQDCSSRCRVIWQRSWTQTGRQPHWPSKHSERTIERSADISRHRCISDTSDKSSDGTWTSTQQTTSGTGTELPLLRNYEYLLKHTWDLQQKRTNDDKQHSYDLSVPDRWMLTGTASYRKTVTKNVNNVSWEDKTANTACVRNNCVAN